MNPIVVWLAARLKERSTWLGIIALITAAGVKISPALTEQLVTIGAGIAGLVLALTADPKANLAPASVEAVAIATNTIPVSIAAVPLRDYRAEMNLALEAGDFVKAGSIMSEMAQATARQ
jgi:aspartate oxidase